MEPNASSQDPPVEPFRPWLADAELQEQRLRLQVAIILDQLPDAAAVWGQQEAGGLDYLYRRGRVLVRDADLDRVRDVLGLSVGNAGDEPLINGVTALAVDDTQDALRRVDQAIGTGVARPDHVFYVTPASCCPATEPVPVLAANPDPDVRRDPSSTGQGTFVTVVDTGFIPALVDPQHPWLADVTGDEEVFDSSDIGPYVGHGTFVAGVLRCVAPQAQVRVEGFLTHGGAIYESRIACQLDQAMRGAPDVISMSAGCTTRDDLPPLAFEVLYEARLRQMKGTVLVCAAGNDGSRRPFWPAASEYAVSVGALDRDGSRAGFSNFGSWVDVYALGVDVVNAYPNGTFRYQEPPAVDEGKKATFTNAMAAWSGTSFSTPLFAGMIAARMSRNGQSARQAADSLLRIARAHAQPGVGPVAEITMIGDVDPG